MDVLFLEDLHQILSGAFWFVAWVGERDRHEAEERDEKGREVECEEVVRRHVREELQAGQEEVKRHERHHENAFDGREKVVDGEIGVQQASHYIACFLKLE